MSEWIYGVILAIIGASMFSYWAGKRRGEQLTLRRMVPQLQYQFMQSQNSSPFCGLLSNIGGIGASAVIQPKTPTERTSKSTGPGMKGEA